jgi:hypothetical protein
VRGGQGGHQLAQRGADGLPEAEVGVGGAGQQHEQGAGLIGGQPGDVGAVARHQGDAPVRAAHGVDGHARRGQGLDVAHDGANRHLQAPGQLAGGELTAGLQQQHDRQKPVRSHHGSKDSPGT